MLYKKYHRNFVRRFKKGVKFRCEGFSKIFEVVTEPYVIIIYHSLSIVNFSVERGTPAFLIYSSGKLCDIKIIEFIENVV